MNLARNLGLKLKLFFLSWRNHLLKRSTLFLIIYCAWLRRLDRRAHREERREGYWRHTDLENLALRKLANAPDGINWKVRNWLGEHHFYYVPLAPNKFLVKERVFRGKKFQLSRFPWKIDISKRRGRAFWQDMNIDLGKFLEIAVRWDEGRRCYVAIRFWLIRWKRFLYNNPESFGRFEFYHELWLVENHFPVSRWWWGSGWFRVSCYRGNFERLYRHFGHLFHWTWQGQRYGFLGKELTARQKEAVFTIYERERKKWGKETAQMYLDAITGYSRNLFREYYWACCIDCAAMMRPEEESDLRCEECEEKYLGIAA